MKEQKAVGSVSVVIPTYLREEDLGVCLDTVIEQTVRPIEVIIVDDAQMADAPRRQALEAAGIDCIYHRKTENRGITFSRNIGAALARGDYILCLDDDVELATDHIEQMLEVFKKDVDGTIGGVSGFDEKEFETPLFERILNWLQFVLLIGGPMPGRVLPSGFCTTIVVSSLRYQRVIECDVLPGCNAMFKKSCIGSEQWGAHYSGYSLGEDQDFSYRISRTYRLVKTPAVRFLHNESPAGRPDPRSRGKMAVVNRYEFYKNRVRRAAWQDIFFLYALSNFIAFKTLSLFLRPSTKNWKRLQGLFDGVRQILTRRA